MAEDAEVDERNDSNNKMVKRLPLFKKLNVPTGYLTSLHFGKK